MQDSCMSLPPLDHCDRKILEMLQRDATMPRKKLAELCHVSEATCSRRIASLVKRGYISGSTAILDRSRLGLKLTVFVLVMLEHERDDGTRQFLAGLRKSPWILSISHISGDYDYLMQMALPDMAHYNEFTEQYLHREPCVKRYLSLFEIKNLKFGAPLPLLPE